MKSEKQLYQWDINQFLTELQPTAEYVDYSIGNEVIRIEADGTRCRIPDEVLQTYGGKPNNGLLRNRTGRIGRRHHPGTPARMATGGTRRDGHVPERRRIETAAGAEWG